MEQACILIVVVATGSYKEVHVQLATSESALQTSPTPQYLPGPATVLVTQVVNPGENG